MRFSSINLSQLAVPDVIEALDYETILADLKEDFVARVPDYDVQNLETDPAIKILEVAAYRELILRALINDKARALLLASAQGTDLDHLGAYFGVERLLITAPTETTAAVYETDADLRLRIQAAPEAFSTAGPEGAYIFHARTADASIKSVGVYAYRDGLPEGEIRVYILTSSGDGQADSNLIEKVMGYFRSETVQDKIPATDILSVLSASITEYTVDVVLKAPYGPDANVIKAQAETALAAYVASRHAVGVSVPVSAISKAAFIDGLEAVDVISPAADIAEAMGAAPYCTAINVTVTRV